MNSTFAYGTPRSSHSFNRCHRCYESLKLSCGAWYCPSCLWDELEDPTRIRRFRYHRTVPLKS